MIFLIMLLFPLVNDSDYAMFNVIIKKCHAVSSLKVSDTLDIDMKKFLFECPKLKKVCPVQNWKKFALSKIEQNLPCQWAFVFIWKRSKFTRFLWIKKAWNPKRCFLKRTSEVVLDQILRNVPTLKRLYLEKTWYKVSSFNWVARVSLENFELLDLA